MKSKNMSKMLMDNMLYICLLLMIVVIAMISPSFISVRVLSDVLIQSAPKMLLAMGMLVVIIAGGMDMTVGRLAGLGAVIRNTGAAGDLLPEILAIASGNAVDCSDAGICFCRHGFRYDHGHHYIQTKCAGFSGWSGTAADHLWRQSVIFEKSTK